MSCIRRVNATGCARLPMLVRLLRLDEGHKRVRCRPKEGDEAGARKRLGCQERGRRYPSDRCFPSAIWELAL